MCMSYFRVQDRVITLPFSFFSFLSLKNKLKDFLVNGFGQQMVEMLPFVRLWLYEWELAEE